MTCGLLLSSHACSAWFGLGHMWTRASLSHIHKQKAVFSASPGVYYLTHWGKWHIRLLTSPVGQNAHPKEYSGHDNSCGPFPMCTAVTIQIGKSTHRNSGKMCKSHDIHGGDPGLNLCNMWRDAHRESNLIKINKAFWSLGEGLPGWKAARREQQMGTASGSRPLGTGVFWCGYSPFLRALKHNSEKLSMKVKSSATINMDSVGQSPICTGATRGLVEEDKWT